MRRRRVLGDNGELNTPFSNGIVSGVEIQVQSTGSNRPDLKGGQEAVFHSARAGAITGLPGEKTDAAGESSAPTIKLGAALTINDLMRILLGWMRWYNRYHRIQGYPMQSDMVAMGVQPYPLDLLRFGMVHRPGHMRSVSLDLARLHLLPGDEATVDRRGLIYDGLLYDNSRLLVEGQFVKGVAAGQHLPIASDPRSTNAIYLRNERQKALERCDLSIESAGYANMTFYELHRIRERDSDVRRDREGEAEQAQLEFQALKADVVRGAQARTKAATEGMPTTGRTEGASEHRKAGIDEEHHAGAWSLGTAREPSAAIAAPQGASDDSLGGITLTSLSVEARSRLREQRRQAVGS
jgi:hypothetical protein